eukprot:CAMPEP_0204534404 /NCGR_PEP_ID=MMETSP0661-20131031/12930_1 /ASSEMBLY_ACC=CAM_ASM_000606 /TAXON_ID=109239 /ORGANISM="Alexandrium margalefi, Strain AMGDE01CS-322" /LENGTH=62 /DNA_ID=CAMNT_0051540855 /DNA_START=119 /DNA_END=304 /DNA_ORIENTATION=-
MKCLSPSDRHLETGQFGRRGAVPPTRPLAMPQRPHELRHGSSGSLISRITVVGGAAEEGADG